MGKRSGKRTASLPGLRIVALFELAKGVVVVLAGLGILALGHHHLQTVGEEVVRHLHFNPARHNPKILADAMRLGDARLQALAMAALIYASVRFVESYALWRQRVWAEWFAILSGSIYLPVEIYEMTVSVTAVKAAILVVNLVVVGVLVRIRWQERRQGRRG